jgi:hypothetical protein
MTVSVLGPVKRDANSGERDGRRVGRSANVLSAKLPQPPTRVKNGLWETNRILHRSGPLHTSLAEESGGSIEKRHVAHQRTVEVCDEPSVTRQSYLEHPRVRSSKRTDELVAGQAQRTAQIFTRLPIVLQLSVWLLAPPARGADQSPGGPVRRVGALFGGARAEVWLHDELRSTPDGGKVLALLLGGSTRAGAASSRRVAGGVRKGE